MVIYDCCMVKPVVLVDPLSGWMVIYDGFVVTSLYLCQSNGVSFAATFAV